MAKYNITAIPGGSGGSRTSGGITGTGGRNINPVYNTPTSNVKVIKAGSKPLTQKTVEASRANEAARIAKANARLKKYQEGRMESFD